LARLVHVSILKRVQKR